ncbi:hypothetical protein [Dickeya phage Mysterion]|uniref:Uncharacterized protein n=1 Tax=Dickeya phage Mysterion TaxID=2320193 RepID=A0A385IG19_9CAUD|nr:hypothetical protein HOU15_gp16 [Dickeya phage Mysterion]AXY81949.1 hypothetical protein [Dickeya phage Mysterion]
MNKLASLCPVSVLRWFIMSKQQTKVYIRKGHGTYYVRNGIVRFRADVHKSNWINAAHSPEELHQKVLSGRVIGPIIVNNFQEKVS